MAALRLRQFPLPISVGTDIVRVSRVHRLLFPNDGATPSRFIEKTLTQRERDLSQEKLTSYLSRAEDTQPIATYIAGRWAAKEAVIKACTWRRLVMSDVEIHTGASGAPYGVILDKPSSGQATGQVVQVSISHDGDHATAVCIAALEPQEGDVGGEAQARENS